MSEEEQKAYFQNRMLNLLSRRKTEEEVRQYLKKLQCPEEITDRSRWRRIIVLSMMRPTRVII